jgi:formylglycine-generating enzyme required for sulfatase activity
MVLPGMLRSAGKKAELADAADPARPGKPSTAPKDRPAQRIEDGRTYYLWKGRFYLPVGYEPADQPELAGDGWPIEIVRKVDGVKFLRVPGGTLQMGARDKSDAERTDADSTNLPPHDVVVKGFYIQKHEVTNGELLAYE